MSDYVEKAMLMDYCLGKKTQVIDCNDIAKFPKADVLEKSEADKIMDLGGIIKQNKELLWSAYNKGYKQAVDDMLNKQTVGLEKDILAKIEQVENEPTGARYWIGTQELKNILERY